MNEPRGQGAAFCGACGARIEADVRFCTACGEPQAAFMSSPGGATIAAARTEVLPEQPPAAQTEVLPPPDRGGGAGGLAVVGYICAILLPLVGLVIGATLHRRSPEGIRIVILGLSVLALESVAAAILVAR